eukprot:jgi/Tetstr1/454027/TSEL_040946.t1
MLIAVVPSALGYGMAALCPVRQGNSGDDIPFRPPAAVFGIVWPVLYALLGWSMYRSWAEPAPARLAAHAALVAMITAWIPLTSCQGRIREGVWLLLASVLACAYAVALDGTRTTALLLLPLLTWLSFATLMSAWQTGGAAPAGGPPRPRLQP